MTDEIENISLEESLKQGENWVEDIDLEKSQPVSNDLSDEIPEWLSALNSSEKNWDEIVSEPDSEELDRIAEHTSAAWKPEFSTTKDEPKINDNNAIELRNVLDGKGIFKSIKAALNNLDFKDAGNNISLLLKNNEMVDELITLLEASLINQPVNVALLQSLGDAYLKQK